MNRRAQSAFEYLLMITGVVLFLILVVLILRSTTSSASQMVSNSSSSLYRVMPTPDTSLVLRYSNTYGGGQVGLVAVGTTVQFKNDGTVSHNLAGADACVISSTAVSPGASYSFTLSTAGTCNYIWDGGTPNPLTVS